MSDAGEPIPKAWIDVERGINRGYFVTPEELEQRRPSVITSAIEHLPNVRIRMIPGMKPYNVFFLRVENGRGCPLTVYLDRIKVSPMLRRGSLADETINTLIYPTTVAAIEVYPSHLGAPPDFPPVDNTGGVVLMWTK